MKTNIATTVLLAIAFISFTACGDNAATTNEGQTPATGQETTTGHQHEEGMVYQCPMKCEGELVYDQPGRCPVCKMELKPVEGAAHDDHDGHQH
jgi:protein SCO1